MEKGRSLADYGKRVMTSDNGKITVLMEKEEAVTDGQSSNQAINGAANNCPSLP